LTGHDNYQGAFPNELQNLDYNTVVISQGNKNNSGADSGISSGGSLATINSRISSMKNA